MRIAGNSFCEDFKDLFATITTIKHDFIKHLFPLYTPLLVSTTRNILENSGKY